jgi:hypothetical protein
MPFDPYAPPRDAPLPPRPITRPPPGIRRYGVDLSSYDSFVDRMLRARMVRGLVVGTLFLGTFAVRTQAELLPFYFATAIPLYGLSLTVSYFLARARLRASRTRVIQGFEVLAAPRVLRRTAYNLAPAEIAAPEVLSVVETAEGLSIAGRTRSLFVSRAVADYAALRDHVRAWHPVETWTGPRAFLRQWRHSVRARVYDESRDALLASDPSLASELAAVRALAMPIDAGFRRRRALRMVLVSALLLWAAWSVWQLFALDTREPHRRSGRAGVGALLGFVVHDRVA